MMTNDKLITFDDDQLRSLGFTDTQQACRNLGLLASAFGTERFISLRQELLGQVSAAADADMALNNFERFVGGLSDPSLIIKYLERHRSVLLRLVTIFGASRFLSAFLASNAEDALSWLGDENWLERSAGREALAGSLNALLVRVENDKEFLKALRMFRKQEMLRIALRDLLRKADLQEVVGELSDLAEVCLQASYERAAAVLTGRYGRPLVEHPDGAVTHAGFAVIAMGKLGGRELNFSSDVDLLYVYEADGETEGAPAIDGGNTNKIGNQLFFTKIGEQISAAIGSTTEDGFVFRVDLRLRPEGQRGPLALSLNGYELYYESWGQTWERAALIKARPVAGDDATGREFLSRIGPFVYRKYLDYNAITEIGEMKFKINRDAELKHKAFRNVKLGYGGIREVEFVIQALQLIYGGRDRSLRERSSLKALHQLSQKELITYQEHAALAKAYVFLRTVEHRIQMLDDLQSQMMPADDAGLRLLARRNGYRERGDEMRMLLADYEEHTGKVRAIFDALLAFKTDSGTAARVDDCGLLLDLETTEQEATTLLSRAGFNDPGKAYRNVRLLQEGPALVHQTPRSRKLFYALFPSLFSSIVASPDPDAALSRLESFLAENGSWEALQSLANMDSRAINVLIAVFANSEYLSRLLISRPQYLQRLVETRAAPGAGASARLAKELRHSLARCSGLPEQLDALRIFKHQEELRIGMADLLSGEGLPAVSRDLSRLAEVCVDAALRMAAAETARRFGVSEPIRGLVVVGAGRLGGRELIYGSDLDILFVFSEERADRPPNGMTLFELFNKIAEKTISYLSSLTREGFVFRIDTRLRPSGSKGPLAQSIEAFTSYYASHAATWEFQAMLRTRFTAGDRQIGDEFCSAMLPVLLRGTDRGLLAEDIRSMRRKMETELGGESAFAFNIKQGFGGLVDIEFVIQYLQLLHGRENRSIMIPGTLNALRALRKVRLLSEPDFDTLRRANGFLRLIESRMRIISNQAATMLQRNAIGVKILAVRIGYAGQEAGASLLADYDRTRQEVRGVFDRMVV